MDTVTQARTRTAAAALDQVTAYPQEAAAAVGAAPDAVQEQVSSWLSWDPAELRRVSPSDARAMSKVLFARMAELEEGTHEYQYVRNTLVELNMALVRFAAQRFRTRSEPMEDIVQVGTIGLIKAINRFDLEQENEFPTFAMPTIIGEIKRFFRDTSWAVHVPRRLQELRLVLAKATDALTYRLGRAPTVTELAAHLELSEAEVREGMVAANGYSVSSIDAGSPGSDSDEEGATFVARLGEDDPGMASVENLISLKPLLAGLGERDRQIISMRFGAEMTQSQIGEALGVSQMHVSRLLSRALGTLRSQLLTED
ncbi:RNA polymerase sigma factor SigF [Streptacidiphilus cavernicola]|uniref:RNA polymerase sigma factor SigF n=1 Tax=Streptacidiphilus cavernicola TaxID=3342716 RepID=A0ABV6VPG5_9ACTN